MKCIFCPKEIDETKVIHPENMHDQKSHSKALESWQQVSVSVSRNGGTETVFVGHTCPDDSIDGNITITKKGKK